MGQYHYAIFPWLALFRQEVASQRKAKPLHSVPAGSGQLAGSMLGSVRSGQVKHAVVPSIEILKHSVLSLPVEKICGRHRIASPVQFGPHHHQLLGIRIRHGRQDSGIQHRVDGVTGADSEGQRDYGNSREAGALAQLAQGVAEIMKYSTHYNSY